MHRIDDFFGEMATSSDNRRPVFPRPDYPDRRGNRERLPCGTDANRRFDCM
jgi:hypothetical protein